MYFLSISLIFAVWTILVSYDTNNITLSPLKSSNLIKFAKRIYIFLKFFEFLWFLSEYSEKKSLSCNGYFSQKIYDIFFQLFFNYKWFLKFFDLYYDFNIFTFYFFFNVNKYKLFLFCLKNYSIFLSQIIISIYNFFSDFYFSINFFKSYYIICYTYYFFNPFDIIFLIFLFN